MFELVPFKKEHLEPLMDQKINAYVPDWIRQGHASKMEGAYSFTGMIQGEVMVCGGVTELWSGRGHVWCIFSESSKPHFLAVFRGIKRFLNEAPFQRLELSIPCDFGLGHKRAELLGFELECFRAKKYLPSGQDSSLYAKVKQVGLS